MTQVNVTAAVPPPPPEKRRSMVARLLTEVGPDVSAYGTLAYLSGTPGWHAEWSAIGFVLVLSSTAAARIWGRPDPKALAVVAVGVVIALAHKLKFWA